jgi:hypothetical protein
MMSRVPVPFSSGPTKGATAIVGGACEVSSLGRRGRLPGCLRFAMEHNRPIRVSQELLNRDVTVRHQTAAAAADVFELERR